MMGHAETGSPAVEAVVRLQEAINHHDLDALSEAFAQDYAVEIPVHPARSFRGRAQVRRNWEQIFRGVPDLHAEIVELAIDGDTVWAEWDWAGTRHDGGRHHLRGTTILGLEGDRFAWGRFFLEPVDDAGVAIDQAIADTLGGGRMTP
jgi:ketosteroid isomerase-like protein